MRLARAALERLRDRFAPPPVTIAADQVPQGWVVTKAYADYRSPSGRRYATVATYPSGLVAERKWTDYEVDAGAAHRAAIARHKRRTLPA